MMGVEILIFVSLERVQLTHRTHRSWEVAGFKQRWTDVVACVELIRTGSREGTFGHVCCLLMAAELLIMAAELLRVTLQLLWECSKGTHAPSSPADAGELAMSARICHLSAS